MNRVSISSREIPEPSWKDNAEKYALTILELLRLDHWEVSVVFTGDDFIRELNRNYRDKDEPTDVLSFGMGELVQEGKTQIYLAGDIVISLPAMMRNAQDFGVEPDGELKRLILHGILHLAGFDHESNDEEEPMLRRQEEILSQIKGERIL